MAIIKIMGLISLPDPGHICGRREKGKGNGMERDENATGKRILSRLSPATPCHALQRRQTEQEDLPSFLLRFPSSSLHKCLIIFSVWCHSGNLEPLRCNRTFLYYILI